MCSPCISLSFCPDRVDALNMNCSLVGQKLVCFAKWTICFSTSHWIYETGTAGKFSRRHWWAMDGFLFLGPWCSCTFAFAQQAPARGLEHHFLPLTI